MGWPGQCVLRNIGADRFSIYNIYGRGLFRDAAHVRAVSSFLTADVPQQESIDIEWEEVAGVITMTVSNASGVRLERDFFLKRDRWEVEHVCFELPGQYRRQGHAKRMMRASVEVYDQLSVERVNVMAAGTDGGYAWAKAGFVADDEPRAKMLILRLAQNLPPAAYQAVSDVVMRSAPGNLLFDMAHISVAGLPHFAWDFLRRSSWAGHIDLTKPACQFRLAQYLR